MTSISSACPTLQAPALQAPASNDVKNNNPDQLVKDIINLNLIESSKSILENQHTAVVTPRTVNPNSNQQNSLP